MAKERIVQTIIETREEIRIRRATGPVECPACGRAMTSPEALARRLGLSVREVFRRIEQGELHCVELPDGGVYVCDGAAIEKSG
jgi:transposase-like protein